MNQSRRLIKIPLPFKSLIKIIEFNLETFQIHVTFFETRAGAFPDFFERNLSLTSILESGRPISVKTHFTHELPPPVSQRFQKIAHSVTGTYRSAFRHVPRFSDEINFKDTLLFEKEAFDFLQTISGSCDTALRLKRYQTDH